MHGSSERQRSTILFFLLTLILIGLFFIQLFGFGPSDDLNRGWSTLPVSIRAGSQADYSHDDALIVEPVNDNIFEQIIIELQGSGSLDERVSTLQVSLSMPVPTMTLNPQMPTSMVPLFTSTTTSGVHGSTTPQTTASFVMTGTVVTPTPTSTWMSLSPSPTQPSPVSTSNPTRKPRPTPRPKPTRRP